MYTDRMVVSRVCLVENAFGVSEQKTTVVEDLNGVPCRFSFRGGEATVAKTGLTSPIELTPKIFYNPKYVLQANDNVVVMRNNGTKTIRVYEGLIAEPTPYDTHYQANFLIEERS